MATIAPIQRKISSPPPSRTPPLHRITVDEYERIVEVYTRPDKQGRYRSRKDFKPGQQVPVVIADQPLPPTPVADLMP